jgi:single-stranded DNA-binding protein
MATYQMIIFEGRLGKDPDPEPRTARNGAKYVTLEVAVNRPYYDQGQRKDEVIWFKVYVPEKVGVHARKYLRKGSSVAIMGKLVPDRSNGNAGHPRIRMGSDGRPHADYEVHAIEVHFGPNRSDNGPQGDKSKPDNAQDDEDLFPQDEIDGSFMPPDW